MNDMERLGYYSDVRERVHINTLGFCVYWWMPPFFFFLSLHLWPDWWMMRGPFLIWILSAIRLVPSGSSSCLGCRHSTHRPPDEWHGYHTVREFFRTDGFEFINIPRLFFLFFSTFSKSFSGCPRRGSFSNRSPVRSALGRLSFDTLRHFSVLILIEKCFLSFWDWIGEPSAFHFGSSSVMLRKNIHNKEKKKLNLLSKLSDSFTGAWARRVSFFFLVPSCCCCCCLVGLMERNGQTETTPTVKRKREKQLDTTGTTENRWERVEEKK